jgi:hypothetical protein
VQGSLSEFRLAEILQLVAVQQKTGLLRLVRGQQLVTFYFDHGVMVSCRDRRHQAHDPLLEYMARTGYLQPDTVTYLRSRLESSKEDLADLLVSEHYVSEDELEVALEDLAQEMVWRTFSWREGSYQFISGEEALVGLRARVSLKIEAVLMEGARRADEWPRLLEKLPGPDVVLDAVHSAPTTLGPRACGLLQQMTGIMRLGDLVSRARMPEFEVYEIVAHGVDAGLVHILEKPAVPVEKPAVRDSPRAARRRTPKLARVWQVPRPAGWMLAVLFSLLTALGANYVTPHLTDPAQHDAEVALQSEEARARLRTSIEVYRALHGRYPQSLLELEQDDLASPELLQRAGPLRYAVGPQGRDFQLSGTGAFGAATPRRP